MRRAAAAAAFGLAVVVAGAGPAHAHSVGGVEPTNYRSEITALSPAVPGLSVRLLDLGRRIEVVNRTGRDAVILGDNNEPYLRVGPGGVHENRRSPTLYQNRLVGSTEIVQLPPEADPSAPPDWRRRSGGQRVTWTDHRTRWDGPDPPAVEADPGRVQAVSRWSVAMDLGGDPVIVTGGITWVPAPSPLPWFVAALVLFAATVAAGATAWWPVLLSGATALVVVVDAVRFWGAATLAGGSVAGDLLGALPSAILELVAWAAGVWAVGAIQRRRPAGLYVAMAVGLVLGFVSGVGDLLVLGYSQVPSALPPAAARAAVPVILGVGLGLAGGGFLALRASGAIQTAEPARR